MRKARSAPLVLLALLALGLFGTIPVEDRLETVYDESETVPYESALPMADGTPQTQISVAIVQATIAHQALPPALLRVISVRNHGSDAQHFAETTRALACLCTFLC